MTFYVEDLIVDLYQFLGLFPYNYFLKEDWAVEGNSCGNFYIEFW